MYIKYASLLTVLFFWFLLLEGYPTIQNTNYPSKEDTVLYLHFDKGTKYKITSNKHTTRYYQNVCPPSSYIIDNIPFRGETIDGYNLRTPDTLRKRELKKYRVVHVQELNHFLRNEYVERDPKEYAPKYLTVEPIGPDPMGSESYWRSLKNIYIVERVKRNRFSVTKVKRDVTIE
jgi:hypothetical protein